MPFCFFSRGLRSREPKGIIIDTLSIAWRPQCIIVFDRGRCYSLKLRGAEAERR